MATAAASGDGVANAVTFISGTTATRLLWPESSIPSTFTVCSVTRYTGGVRRLILTCDGSPSQSTIWHHGHHWGRRIVYYNGWKTSTSSHGVVDDWLVMCGTNAGPTAPGNIVEDQDEIGTSNGGGGGCRLNIGYWYDAASDFWSLHSLLI